MPPTVRSAPYARIEPGPTEIDRRYSGVGGFLALVAEATCTGLGGHSGARDAAQILQSKFGSSRSLAQSSGTSGGYTVPTALHDEILQAVEQVAVARPRATLVGMPADEVPIPIVNQQATPGGTTPPYFGGFNLAWVGENQTLPSTDASFRQSVLTACTLAGTIEVNASLLKNAPALSPLLRKMFAEAVAYMEDRAFLASVAPGQPASILASPALLASAARASGSAISFADCLKVWGRSLPSSRRRSTWLLSRGAESAFLAMTGAGVLPGAFAPDPGEPPADYWFMGRPVCVTEHLPALNTLGDLMLADLSSYVIGDRLSIEIMASEHVQFAKHSVVLRVVHRVAGVPIGSGPITPPDGGATVSPFVALGTA